MDSELCGLSGPQRHPLLHLAPAFLASPQRPPGTSKESESGCRRWLPASVRWRRAGRAPDLLHNGLAMTRRLWSGFRFSRRVYGLAAAALVIAILAFTAAAQAPRRSVSPLQVAQR